VARDVVAPDLQHVLEARGGDEGDRRGPALEHGIGRRGRAVEDAQDVGRRPARTLRMAAMKPAERSSGVEGVLAIQVAPVAASARVMSVKVPPTSMAIVPVGGMPVIVPWPEFAIAQEARIRGGIGTPGIPGQGADDPGEGCP
jgi:hypothetical protein